MVTVTVVIPTYNRPAAFQSALASVDAQTRQPEQIIVVDDASVPAFELQARESNKTPVLVVRQEKNQGASAARQRALQVVQTSHVAFLDSDDEWRPEKLEKQVAHLATLEHSDMTALCCGWQYRELVPGGILSAPVVPRASNRLMDFASGCWFCPGSTALVAAAALRDAGGFDNTLRRLEDLDLFLRFARGGGRLSVTPYTGAIIQRGRNARRAHVTAAVDALTKKFASTGAYKIPDAEFQNLRAYLALEQAAAARNERAHIDMLKHLARSILLAPRTSLHLQNWYASG
jgi:glycosyltransferase involved in cell wall biosynthesis